MTQPTDEAHKVDCPLAGVEPHRVVYRSNGLEISTNDPKFKWPNREEKIAGLLTYGLIDEAEAERLRNKPSEEPQP